MIRRYVKDDTNAIVDVWFKASVIAHFFVPEKFWEKEKKDIKEKYLPAAETWVYEKEGKAVGFISLLENHVGGLFVHPEFQGIGIGRKLLDHALQLKGSLTLDVFKENAKSTAFYEKYGFTKTGESLHEETGCVNVNMKISKKAGLE